MSTQQFTWNYTPPAFEPVKYIPAGHADFMRDLVVWQIYAVAHEPLPDGANHWCFYLQVGEAHSVRIDVTPDYNQAGTVLQGGYKANIVVSYLEYLYSNSAQHAAAMAVCPDLKVEHVLDYIIASNRHQYEFDSQGRGCRNWTSDQIDLLRGQGWLTDDTETDAAKAAIRLRHPEQEPVELWPGAYY